MDTKKEIKRVAFFVPEFPAVSLTFIINQIADLKDRGIEVVVYALRKGSEENISERYFSYHMRDHIHYITPPESKFWRIILGVGIALRLLFIAPRTLVRALDVKQYGANARALYTLFWINPLVGEHFNVIHCHFGTVATKYLMMRSILNDHTKFVTTFYGYDVSHTPKVKGMDCYRELIKECDTFLVMSENMKSRVLPLGVPEEKIEVHPISIDVLSYKFNERTIKDDETLKITSVGRFVEKKGFDDLLRSIAIVKEKARRPFVLNIVGGGELSDELHALAHELNVEDVVDFKGFMKLEDVLALYEGSHLYVQASKTAQDGDME